MDEWLDTLEGTAKWCPRCRWYPFHGATDRSLCCGVLFVTERHTLRWFIVRPLNYTTVTRVALDVLGGHFTKLRPAGWVTSDWDMEPNTYRHMFPSQEAADRFTKVRELTKLYPYSNEEAKREYDAMLVQQ